MNIETCYSPELIGQYDLENKIVVIVDIFRATSCMVTGLANGIPHIIPVATKEECLAKRKDGYLLAGERNGKKIKEFEIGNSPLEYLEVAKEKQPVCMTTTNGTRAINLSKKAKEIIIGSFLNLNAVTKYIKEKKEEILIFCAGWKGRYSLEDALFAGALVNNSISKNSTICDASLAAMIMYENVNNNIYDFLLNSSHAKRLAGIKENQKNNNIANDIEYCCSLNKFSIVPILKKDKLILCKN